LQHKLIFNTNKNAIQNIIKMFKNLEKQTYLLYFKDGIFELLFGSMFIIFAANTWFDMQEIFRPYWLRLLIIPVAVVLAFFKEFITKKRIGKVQFSKLRRKKSRWMFVLVIAAQIITLVAFLLAATGKISSAGRTSLLGLLIEFFSLVSIFYALTWFTGYNTFVFAGLVFAFSTPFLLLINPELHHSLLRIGIMIVAGSSFFVVGMVRFINFLKKFPKSPHNE